MNEYAEMDVKDVEVKVIEKVWNLYEDKISPYREKYLPFEKVVVLKILDRNWIEHIDMMSKLREGIHLRSYAQGSPLQAYISEGFKMYEDMMANISAEVINYCMKLRFVEQETPEQEEVKEA